MRTNTMAMAHLAAFALATSAAHGVEAGPGLDPMSPPPTITRFGRSARFGGRGVKADQRRAAKRRQKTMQKRKDR